MDNSWYKKKEKDNLGRDRYYFCSCENVCIEVGQRGWEDSDLREEKENEEVFGF